MKKFFNVACCSLAVFLFLILLFALISRCTGSDTAKGEAGGIPLAEELMNAKDYKFDLTFTPDIQEDRFIEYEDILSDIHRGIEQAVERIKLDHNSGQWRAVAEAIRQDSLPSKARYELVENVLRYPLTHSLPPSVAITREALSNWQKARRIFMRWLPQLRVGR